MPRLDGYSERINQRRPWELRSAKYARMAELVDAVDSNSTVEMREGSSPSLGTKRHIQQKKQLM